MSKDDKKKADAKAKDTDALKELRQKLDETLADLQRTRADFENYRKRVEQEKEQATVAAKARTVLQLLPVIDNIDRALSHLPKHLKDDTWAQSVANLSKHLEKSLDKLQLTRIDAKPGAEFNPNLHEAIQMEDGKGDKEVVAEELQSGYRLGNRVIRHSMVKVTRK